MVANKKPDACDAGSVYEIAKHRTNNFTLEPTTAPAGFTLLPEAEASQTRELIGLYMADCTPDCSVELEPGDSDAHGVAVVMTQPWTTGEARTFYVAGWRPMPRVDVVSLHVAFNSIYNGDPVQDDLVHTLGDRRQVKAMASDFQDCRATARELRGEMDARTAVCATHLDLLADALNWVGHIPASAKIFVKNMEKK